MSTARLIPETWELSGDDAWETLRCTGRRRLLRDAFQRLRWADGFSHSRSLAFLIALATVQGVIALVGLATAVGDSSVSDVIVGAVQGAAPGPVAGLLTQAVAHSQATGNAGSYVPLLFGVVGGLLTAMTAMGQLERGLNRLYGVERDRPFSRKYGLGLLLAASAGVLATAAFALLAFGRTWSGTTGNATAARILDVASWPGGLLVLGACIALLFRWCPRRHQPAWSWLAFGSGVCLALWTVIALCLGFFFRHSAGFGETYGPLAGMIALLLWALLSSMALFFGAAVAAQLEAVRASASSPQDERKVQASEPDATPARTPAAEPALSMTADRS
ncbi:MAG TPA: YihY/virulence factor BrkB family protein [Acidimicrobiia bacterium]|nr:YihY/virulence factor BrkB family protein [Acidimicrobiia bacterium]